MALIFLFSYFSFYMTYLNFFNLLFKTYQEIQAKYFS